MLEAFHVGTRRRPADGYTDHEAAQFAALERPGVCWWHRASDLRAAGFIVWRTNADGSRMTKPGEHGTRVGVSVITDAGRRALRAMKDGDK
jgi:hypothetical protein